MNHNFTALVGKLTGLLQAYPETQLSGQQARYLDGLREDYQALRVHFASRGEGDDPLSRAYLKCFDLSLGCLYLLERVFAQDPSTAARQTYLDAFSLQVEELDALLCRTEAHTALRSVEVMLQRNLSSPDGVL